MRLRRLSAFAAFSIGLAIGCAKPDSIELGGVCKEQVECKDPADTCLTVGPRSRCSMVCTPKDACPEGFVCAKLDISVERSGQSTKTGKTGYCLPRSEVPANAVTL